MKPAFAVLGLALAIPATVRAEPPVTPESQVTAPIGPGGRRGPPPPRLRSNAASARGPSAVDLPSDGAAGLGLVRLADGRYVYSDPADRFTLWIEVDGRVRFADRWRKASARDSQNGRCCAPPPEGVASAINVFRGIPHQGLLERTLHARNSDPVASAKADVLARTRAFRTRLGVAWYREHIRSRLAALPGELERLWSDPGLSLARKKALLFQRWDDCEDRLAISNRPLPVDAQPSIDRLRLQAAARGRRIVEAFVQEQAPAGSGAGFSAGELRQLNHNRKSARSFSPYPRVKS